MNCVTTLKKEVVEGNCPTTYKNFLQCNSNENHVEYEEINNLIYAADLRAQEVIHM